MFLDIHFICNVLDVEAENNYLQTIFFSKKVSVEEKPVFNQLFEEDTLPPLTQHRRCIRWAIGQMLKRGKEMRY